MYQPKKYQKNDRHYIFDFIKNHPFATFVLKGDRLLATHIPVLIEGTPENFTLYSHIADHNEQRPYLNDNTEALLIFQGAQAYVSSSWYKEKNISTWDYSAVHINGRIKLQSQAELESSLEKLVQHFESGQENPLFYKDIPQQMLKEHLPLITGFWFEPLHIQGIAKLHQGYPREDVKSVVDHLKNQKNPNAGQLGNEIQKEHGL